MRELQDKARKEMKEEQDKARKELKEQNDKMMQMMMQMSQFSQTREMANILSGVVKSSTVAPDMQLHMFQSLASSVSSSPALTSPQEQLRVKSNVTSD